MPGPHITAGELAEEFGRTLSWVHHNWAHLADDKGFPMPLLDAGVLTWSRAQVYAWQDRDLSEDERIAAMAFRAAAAAAAKTQFVSTDQTAIEKSTDALNTSLGIDD